MAKRSEGIRRIVLTLSVVTPICWIVFLAIESRGFAHVEPIGWLIIVGGAIIAYFIPKLKGIVTYWILDGFRKDKGA